MPARKRDAERWWTDPEATSASGGHATPAAASGPLLDPLSEATREHSLEAADGLADDDERTEVIPSGSLRAGEAQRVATPTRSRHHGRRPWPATRRVRRTLRHVDPLSVLKLSLFYYGCFVVMGLVFVAIAYGLLSSVGLFDRIERLGRALVLWEQVNITLWFVERWTLFLGLILALLAALVNVFLAFLYNLAADVVGGAELTFVERDL
jgi:hypothetical protein